jgi:membrane protein
MLHLSSNTNHKTSMTLFFCEFIRLAKARNPLKQWESIIARSAESAFFMILALFPFALFALNLLGYLPGVRIRTMNWAEEFLPAEAADMLGGLMREMYGKASGAVLPATLIMALWSAGAGLRPIIRGLNAAADTEETRGFFRMSVEVTLWIIAMAVLFGGALVILSFGGRISSAINAYIPGFAQESAATLTLRWLIAPALLTAFFLLFYMLAPAKKQRLRDSLPGSILSGGGLVVFSALYSVYIERFADYSYIYGSLTAAVLFALWLQAVLAIIFAGGELNRLILLTRENVKRSAQTCVFEKN